MKLRYWLIAVIILTAIVLPPAHILHRRHAVRKRDEVQALEEVRKDDLYLQVQDKMSRLVPRIWPDMGWTEEEIPAREIFRVRTIYRVPCYAMLPIRGRFHIILGVEHDIFVIVNMEMREEIERRRVAGKEQVPSLTISEAIERAHLYLKLLEEEIPPDYALRVWYGSDGAVISHPVWWAVWQPTVNGVYFEENTPDITISLRFHEELGLASYHRLVGIYPMPESTDIRISPAEAAKKAAELAPKVLSSEYYRSIRAGVVNGTIKLMENPVLVLFEPNWMLDRRRSRFLINLHGPPEETRLSWRVSFRVDVKEDDKWHFSGGRIIDVFIDAKTGECVGANFD